MTTTPSSLPAGDEPLHGCVRCGARIPVSQSMCERCNPLGLKAPAASQAHGTVVVGIVVAIIIMAVAARFAMTGVGPFRAELAGVAPAAAGLRVSITVTNDGKGAGSTTCRISDPALPGIGPETAFIQSPVIQPGQTLTFDAVVTSLGTRVIPLSATCER